MRFTSCLILAVGLTGSVAAKLTADEPARVVDLGAANAGPLGGVAELFGGSVGSDRGAWNLSASATVRLSAGTVESSLVPESFVVAQAQSALAELRDSGTIVPPRWLHQVISESSQSDELAPSKPRGRQGPQRQSHQRG